MPDQNVPQPPADLVERCELTLDEQRRKWGGDNSKFSYVASVAADAIHKAVSIAYAEGYKVGLTANEKLLKAVEVALAFHGDSGHEDGCLKCLVLLADVKRARGEKP